jgi:2-oxo-4-hydroxy-4-carboxy--5-ureidoimidazoline (OHCU) decarboxylase
MNSATKKTITDLANANAEAFIDGKLGAGRTAADVFDYSPIEVERAVQAELLAAGNKLHHVEVKAVDAAHDFYTESALARVEALLAC